MDVGLAPRRRAEDPPLCLRLVAHPVRWRLLQELAGSDRSVRELTELVGQGQSLVSYHLGRLRAGGLVQARRSSADGRDSYYAIDLVACGEQLRAAFGALHPGLEFSTAPPARRLVATSRRRRRVLFLCTGNSARSQIAAALLEQMSQATIEAASAGSNPKALHPNAVRVMARRGVDISGNRTTHLDEYVGQRFDAVITLCDKVREVCPEFPSQPHLIHWSIPDPALAASTRRLSYPAFEQTAKELEIRIRFLLALFAPPSTRRSTHAA